MEDTLNETPAGDAGDTTTATEVARLLDLLYDLGDSVVALTTQVAALQARVDELTAAQPARIGGAS